MIHSFLLIGQSNMSGRGFPHEVAPIENKDILVLRNGRWQPMFVPVNPDRVTAGINLAESFADLYARDHGVQVGLIPCADGGTNLDQWQVGGQLFDHACYMAELASRTSDIAGILWHQGESDTGEDRYPLYEERLGVILDTLRQRLGLQDVPLLVGGLGDYLKDCPLLPKFKNYVHINEALRRFAAARPMTGYVDAAGLTSNADFLHFNAASLREFGVRYYREFSKLEDRNRVFSTRDGATVRTELDHL